ncbi:MAG: orotate phosphoribosyltransferase [Methanomassiliicoccaceae archaeon]|nr:orotate phosphoribosyltransferase [Methanomassiliicoccaceae archaeon]
MSEIKRALEKCGALRFGKFTLASGAESDYYVDIKKASTDPGTLYLISQLMAEQIQTSGKRYDRIAGVVLGSVPLAAALSLATGIPYVMVRKERKDHGMSKQIEGDLNVNDNVIVIEDVITSAGSSISAISTLREAGASVEDVITVIDRESGGKEALSSIGVTLTSLARASDLLGSRN